MLKVAKIAVPCLLGLAQATPSFALPQLGFGAASQLRGYWSDVPASGSYAALLDQVLPQTVYLLDESAGFAEHDPAKYSVFGDSWVWNRWWLDGIDISDPLTPGAALVLPPFAAVSSARVWDGSDPGRAGQRGLELQLAAASEVGNYISGAYQIGKVGGIWPPARPIMDFSSGAHSRDRGYRPTALRRQQIHPLQLHGLSRSHGAHAVVDIAASLRLGERRWVDFGTPVTADSGRSPARGTYDEQVRLLSGLLRVAPREGSPEVVVLMQYSERGHAGAELYRQRAETADVQSLALQTSIRGRYGWLAPFFKFEQRQPVERAFSKDLYDPDGQSLFPYAPSGRQYAVGLRGGLELDPWYADMSQTWIVQRPDVKRWSNPQTVLGHTYGRYDWQTDASHQMLGDLRIGVHDMFAPRQTIVSLDAYGTLSYARNRSGHNTLAGLDAGVAAHIEFLAPQRVTPYLQIAKSPIGIDADLAKQLDPDYLNGDFWLRDNGQNILLDTVGGSALRVGPNMRLPNVYTLAVGLEKPFRTYWHYRFSGLTKVYHNTYEIEFDGAPTDFGRYDEGVFYYAPGPSRYRLVQRRGNVPLYYGLHMQVVGERRDHFVFSWAFSAYNSIGRSSFGNGPTANDIGVVDFSSANPNSRQKGVANLDVDRAFNTKIFAGTVIVDELWWFATLTHYDGTPFAPYNIEQSNGQYARTYDQFRGSPFTFVGPLKGAREDYRLNLDVKLRYRWLLPRVTVRVWWLLANVLDFGNEISELQTTTGRDLRLALEQEIPRSFEFGIAFTDF